MRGTAERATIISRWLGIKRERTLYTASLDIWKLRKEEEDADKSESEPARIIRARIDDARVHRAISTAASYVSKERI